MAGPAPRSTALSRKVCGALENEEVELRGLHVGKALAGAFEALPLILGDGFAGDGDGFGVRGGPGDGHRGDLLPVVVVCAAGHSGDGNLGAYGALSAGNSGHGAQASGPAGRQGWIHVGVDQGEQDHVALVNLSDDSRSEGIGVIELLGCLLYTSPSPRD